MSRACPSAMSVGVKFCRRHKTCRNENCPTFNFIRHYVKRLAVFSREKLTNMDPSEIIITFVRENECLYNKTHPDYKNVVKKKRVFEVISEKLKSVSGIEISAKSIEKRWSSLRDMFSRAQRNMKLQPCGSGRLPVKKWDLYDSMSFLTPHVSHRRSKSNFPRPTLTQGQQRSKEFFEGGASSSNSCTAESGIQQCKSIGFTEEVILPAQSNILRGAEPFAKLTPQANILTAQSPKHSMRTHIEHIYTEEICNASIDLDHDYDVAKYYHPTRAASTIPLTPSTTASSCYSSSSSSTPVFRPIQKPVITPELDHFAKKRRKSNSDIEKGFDTAIELLGKVVGDMASTVQQQDPYLNAVEEGLKHVPTGDRIKCLIEILQIIDKYQKI